MYSEDIDERICAFRKMKRLYNTRSNIVHGKKQASDYVSATEFEEFMRISFKKYIEKVHNKYTHNQIIEQLDFD